MSNEIVLHASNAEEPSSRALVVASSSEIALPQQSNQVVEKLRSDREQHRHKQIWTKDPHGGPYRKAKAGDGYDPLTHNPDGTSKELELGYHFPVETGPTSNFVGNHMTQGAIDLVQSELGQKSAKTLRLQAAAQQQQVQGMNTALTLAATNRTNPPKLLVNDDEIATIQVLNSGLEAGIAPVVAVQGGRPPDLTELRKTEANERSFKLLQEYLSAADHQHGSSGGGGGHPNLPYRFIFYIKHHQSAAQHHHSESKGEGTTIGEPFHKVSLTLPPPNRALPHTTHQALTRLFTACGIEASAAAMTSDGTNADATTTTATSLSNWIPEVAELYHQSTAAAQGGPRQEIQAIRTALQLTHHISLLFGGKLTTGSVLPQLEAARRLAAILDQCPPEVAGLRIGLGDGFGTDPSGTVWLHAEAQTSTWLDFFLNEPDVLIWCHQRRRKHREIREKERKAASLLGIGLILAPDSDVENSEEYEAFLKRVNDIGKEGSINKILNKVSVHVVAGFEPSSFSSEGKGRILVPVSSSNVDFLFALRRFGPEAARCAEIAAKEEADLSQLKIRVERKLHLRKLIRHPDLAAQKFRAGCLRMLQHAGTLGPLLDGLPVRLGEVNAFFPGQSHIDISWSFTL